MTVDTSAGNTTRILDLLSLAQVLSSLQRRGYQLVGPTLRDHAIVCDVISGIDDLPAGWTSEHAPARYRLQDRKDRALFGYAVGPDGWKRFLHPPEVLLWRARREGHTLRLDEQPSDPPRYAFLGVRPCELAAIAIQDRVLLREPGSDSIYRARRERAFLIVVNCTASAATCFCASMHTGPPAQAGFDLALTELADASRHVFVAEVGSRAGAQILGEIGAPPAPASLEREAHDAMAQALSSQTRRLNTAGLREILYEHFEHLQWEILAQRCLACGNCTMVCPTCFCTTIEDRGSVDQLCAERCRRWDSCFTQSFSYIHGATVRASIKSRYRQWLTHKLAYWIDQFGSAGCVGCGRCITWCPAAIDLTEEIPVLREQSPALPGADDAAPSRR